MSTPRTIESAALPPGTRLRFEIIFVSAWLAVGLFIVPAFVYWVGIGTLGPYGEHAGLSDFYGVYFADLASLTTRTWLLALGPLLLMSVVRAIYIGVPRGGVSRGDSAPDAPEDDDDHRRRSPPPAAPQRRVEPRIDS